MEHLREKTFVLFVDLQFPASQVSRVGYDVAFIYAIYFIYLFFWLLKMFSSPAALKMSALDHNTYVQPLEKWHR